MKQSTMAELLSQNLRAAKFRYPSLRPRDRKALADLSRTLRLSLSRGEVLFIDGNWYVTHGGLLRIALRSRCWGIRTTLQERQSDPVSGRWVFKAIVYKSRGSQGFVGYGDADPSNCFFHVRGAEMRIAETRAVNRALRKAYGIGLCSVEELGAFSSRVRDLPPFLRHRTGLIPPMVRATANPDCAISSVC